MHDRRHLRTRSSVISSGIITAGTCAGLTGCSTSSLHFINSDLNAKSRQVWQGFRYSWFIPIMNVLFSARILSTLHLTLRSLISSSQYLNSSQ